MYTHKQLLERTRFLQIWPPQNQLLVSHPVQFPPACEFGFLNLLSKNTHYVIRSLTRGEFWQFCEALEVAWSVQICSYMLSKVQWSRMQVVKQSKSA